MEKSLKELYMVSSKHSNYQILPSNLEGLVDAENLVIKSRYEKERLRYISDYVDFKNKTVLDIGGNIGFFTFETSNAGAKRVDYYEGNQTHAEFVARAVEMLGLENGIQVFPNYYLFDATPDKKVYDIAYLMNVIHHFGDDFGNSASMEQAKGAMLSCLNDMAYVTKLLIFQLGFNWCGNREKCLFEHGTKQEMEAFIRQGTDERWDIIKIGVAVKKEGRVVYEDMNEKNNQRQDELGEFLNRPIFIMKSKMI